jgi:hypothetical protein
MGDLPDFERGQIVAVRLAGASAIRTATLFWCIRSDSFQGYVGIHKSWEDNFSEEEQWVKINIDRKRSLCAEEDFFF